MMSRLSNLNNSVFLIFLICQFANGLLFKGKSSIVRNFRSLAPLQSSTASFTDSGAALQMDEVSLSVGNNDIISSIDWTIMPKERWALVGRNGAGKSTLLKAITGKGGENISIREGKISKSKKARLGYLEQKGVSGSTKTVRDEVASQMERLRIATETLTKFEDLVANGDTSDEALSGLAEASVEFEAAGGLTVNQKITGVLQGLGFRTEDHDRFCSEFSGGWQMRIALAKLLLSEPDLLLLDEPSNHLDRGARDWLGKYLSAYDGTLVLVSHDEVLLETAPNSIAEVRNGRLELYKSRTYLQWQQERVERVKQAQATLEANEREIARLQGFVDRFGAKTMGASMAQSKLKQIEKIKNQQDNQIDPSMAIEGDGAIPFLKLPEPPRGSKVLMEVRGMTLQWPSKSKNSENDDISMKTNLAPVVRDATFVVERGMRIAVRGPNGAGKSTVLNALAGRLPPVAGKIEGSDTLRLGFFTQDLAQDLNPDSRAIDAVVETVNQNANMFRVPGTADVFKDNRPTEILNEIAKKHETDLISTKNGKNKKKGNSREESGTISDEEGRKALGALGLSGEKALRLIGHLSGGEKARVALASFVLIPNNLLLLDEPSNHLDVTTLKVLTKALREFSGAVIVVSHDKQFLEELQPTHVLTVRNGLAELEERGLVEQDWNDPLTPSTISVKPTNSENTVVSKNEISNVGVTGGIEGRKGNGQGFSEEERKKSLNAPRRIKKIENLLEKYDKEMADIDDKMFKNGRNSGKLQEIQVEKDALQGKIDKLYAEYEELLTYV